MACNLQLPYRNITNLFGCILRGKYSSMSDNWMQDPNQVGIIYIYSSYVIAAQLETCHYKRVQDSHVYLGVLRTWGAIFLHQPLGRCSSWDKSSTKNVLNQARFAMIDYF